MTYRNSVTWNTMISDYSHHGPGKEALYVLRDMMTAVDQPKFPNYITFVTVLSASAHMGVLSRAGLIDEAENYMSSVPTKPDVVSWHTLPNACYLHRNYEASKLQRLL
ncbi:Pentatricopeptide repeat [Trema orientale]|uniref:Pentatricopeptide repeat n=1 Tax=Trema orientale TaxID=63057 RepID=A0A2P5FF09_TREOI|nr:Pentatricopeptide repeat [Trema orientale]